MSDSIEPCRLSDLRICHLNLTLLSRPNRCMKSCSGVCADASDIVATDIAISIAHGRSLIPLVRIYFFSSPTERLRLDGGAGGR